MPPGFCEGDAEPVPARVCDEDRGAEPGAGGVLGAGPEGQGPQDRHTGGHRPSRRPRALNKLRFGATLLDRLGHGTSTEWGPSSPQAHHLSFEALSRGCVSKQYSLDALQRSAMETPHFKTSVTVVSIPATVSPKKRWHFDRRETDHGRRGETAHGSGAYEQFRKRSTV